jgi:hypothetical protein
MTGADSRHNALQVIQGDFVSILRLPLLYQCFQELPKFIHVLGALEYNRAAVTIVECCLAEWSYQHSFYQEDRCQTNLFILKRVLCIETKSFGGVSILLQVAAEWCIRFV